MALNGTICRHPLASKRFMMIFREEEEEIPEMFELPTRYEAIAPIARGSYGFVCAASDNELVEQFRCSPPAEYDDSSLTSEERMEMYEACTTVAVKKLWQLFERNQSRLWLCAAREIQLMIALKHENIMSASDFFIPLGECETMTYDSVEHLRLNFESVYLVMKKMDYTLREVLEFTFCPEDDAELGNGVQPSVSPTETSPTTVYATRRGSRYTRCPLTNLVLHPLARDYRRFILYQLLRGVGYLHMCPVIHRDIKPENIMLDRNYNLRLCDFGQGRDVVVSEVDGVLCTLLDNCTQWYAAPETLTLASSLCPVGLVDQKSFHSTDVWSIGCIAAEMLMGRPLFYTRRRGGIGQLHAILGVLGELSDVDVTHILAHRDTTTRRLFEEVLFRERKGYTQKPSSLRSLLVSPFNDVEEEEVQLIEQLLCYNPSCRMTVQKALQNSFFLKEGYDPAIDPDDTATHVQAVQPSDIVEAVKGREFLWSLFLQRHPEVQKLVEILEKRNKNNDYTAVESGSEMLTPGVP